MEMMDLPVTSPTTVREVLLMVAEKAGMEPSVLINKSLLYAVNQESAGLDTQVTNADEVATLPPMSGGAL